MSTERKAMKKSSAERNELVQDESKTLLRPRQHSRSRRRPRQTLKSSQQRPLHYQAAIIPQLSTVFESERESSTCEFVHEKKSPTCTLSSHRPLLRCCPPGFDIAQAPSGISPFSWNSMLKEMNLNVDMKPVNARSHHDLKTDDINLRKAQKKKSNEDHHSSEPLPANDARLKSQKDEDELSTIVKISKSNAEKSQEAAQITIIKPVRKTIKPNATMSFKTAIVPDIVDLRTTIYSSASAEEEKASAQRSREDLTLAQAGNLGKSCTIVTEPTRLSNPQNYITPSPTMTQSGASLVTENYDRFKVWSSEDELVEVIIHKALFDRIPFTVCWLDGTTPSELTRIFTSSKAHLKENVQEAWKDAWFGNRRRNPRVEHGNRV